MKRSLALSISLLLAAGTPAGAQNFVNFLRQTQLDTYVQWDVAIDPSGTMTSPAPSGEVGSLYELWAVNEETGAEITIARKYFSEDMPKISLEIQTTDPYAKLARTRVDQPFQIRMAVAGLKNNHLKYLYFGHTGYSFPDGGFLLPPPGERVAQFSNDYAVDSNGEFQIEFPVPTLQGEGGDATKASGMEVFGVSVLLDNNGHGNNADSVDGGNLNDSSSPDLSGSLDDEFSKGYVVGAHMARAEVQVWPLAEGRISGIEATKVYKEIPPITIDLVDLYPDSTTYVRIYKGPASATPDNPVTIGSAGVIIRDSVPQDRTLVLENLGSYLQDSGSYTIEVLHDTPFGTDILTRFHPLQVDWSLGVRGALYSNN